VEAIVGEMPTAKLRIEIIEIIEVVAGAVSGHDGASSGTVTCGPAPPDA
jgi:hypothetical protein